MLLLPAVLALALLQDPAAPAPEPTPATTPADAPATAPAASATAAPAASATDSVAAGLAAYHRRRFTRAAAEFEKALEADPQNAAAAWYLAYTYYKIAEPKRPFDPGKQKAADMFAKAYALDPHFQPTWR
jgi:tetratricopeptide (TPR) repeat protein